MTARPSLAPYACDPAKSRGRRFREAESETRSPFQRDRDRIIHCDSFRRLKYKTQVFVYHDGDNFRTRLTHSLEVAQIARSIARQLGLVEDLAEAVALAHDLGHTPFGHAGEVALDELLLVTISTYGEVRSISLDGRPIDIRVSIHFVRPRSVGPAEAIAVVSGPAGRSECRAQYTVIPARSR